MPDRVTLVHIINLCKHAEFVSEEEAVKLLASKDQAQLKAFLFIACKKIVLLSQGPSFVTEKSVDLLWHSLFGDEDKAPNTENHIVSAYSSFQGGNLQQISAHNWIYLLDCFALPAHIVSTKSGFVSFVDKVDTSKNIALPIYASLHRQLASQPILAQEGHIFKVLLSLCLAGKNLIEVLTIAADKWYPARSTRHVITIARHYLCSWPPGLHEALDVKPGVEGNAERMAKLGNYSNLERSLAKCLPEEQRRRMWQHEMFTLLSIANFQLESIDLP